MFPFQLMAFSRKTFALFLAVSFLAGYCLSQVLSFADFQKFLWSRSGEGYAEQPSCEYQIRRIGSFSLIKPILAVEPIAEDPHYSSLKQEITDWIDGQKAKGTLSDVSIYMKSFDNASWMSLNREAKYHPASFLKVPLLLGFLRIAQSNPSLLEQEVVFEPTGENTSNQLFFTPSRELVPGKKYTLHEVLVHMIAYSDNHASRMIAQYVDFAKVKQLFSDLGLEELPTEREKVMMDVQDFSLIITSIFNASILNPEFSEYAAELLANSAFSEGFKKGFPEGTSMWHKFGEWSYPGAEYELHESGVVFIKDKPYILTILTRGKDMQQLPEVIQGISKKIAVHLLRNV